jgi:hypothetical protein
MFQPDCNVSPQDTGRLLPVQDLARRIPLRRKCKKKAVQAVGTPLRIRMAPAAFEATYPNSAFICQVAA